MENVDQISYGSTIAVSLFRLKLTGSVLDGNNFNYCMEERKMPTKICLGHNDNVILISFHKIICSKRHVINNKYKNYTIS